MSEPENSKQGTIAAMIAIPVMIVCCAAPVFAIGLASAAVGWFSGIGSNEVIGFFVIIAAISFGLNRFRGTKKKV